MSDAASTALNLRRAGDLAGALAAFETAANDLRGKDPQTLIRVLCSWAETLSLVGHYAAAIERANEAVELLRANAMLGPGAMPSADAARVLLVLGTAESHSGNLATEHLAAAVEMARRAAEALPLDENRYLLSVALNHRSGQARATGDLEGAVKASSEAVTVRRELAAHDPSQLGSLASALNNLSAAQNELGDIPVAAASVTEACDILRGLLDDGNMGVLPTLAAAESNAAAIVGDLPDLDRAIALGVRAVEHYEQLAASLPAPAFLGERARSRLVLATCLAGDERYDAAAGLCHAATALLVQNAERLAIPDRMFIHEALRHYLEFAARAGVAVDDELVTAANQTLGGP